MTLNMITVPETLEAPSKVLKAAPTDLNKAVMHYSIIVSMFGCEYSIRMRGVRTMVTE